MRGKQDEIIDESDIRKGLEAYSSDLVRDIGYELRDISSETVDILYSFIGSNSNLSENDVREKIVENNGDESTVDKLIDLLYWYGFLGINHGDGEIKYIYNFNYNVLLLNGMRKKAGANCQSHINPAFWPALMIEA